MISRTVSSIQDYLLRPRTIAVTGASGFIGSTLSALLVGAGHSVIPFSRTPSPHGAYWNLVTGEIEHEKLEGCDAVIHLAGENIAEKRWSEEIKRKILESRIKGTALLCSALTRITRKPKTLISASAIGFYGDRGDQILTEESAPGSGFFPRVAHAWESGLEPARVMGIRVASLRLGIVLSQHGGALKKMLPPFKLYLGGPLGPGTQFMSWITLEDTVRAFYHVLATESLEGAINVTAPNPVTNEYFTKTLAQIVRRPALFRVPSAVLRVMFGELADEALLASTRVIPEKLSASGFEFAYPTIKEALVHELN